MATTEHFYTGNSSTTTYAYTFPILQNSDLKVELDGVIKTENTSGTNNDYSISGTNVVLNSAPASNVDIHIYRVTDVDSAKAVFAAGSSIRAGDLNNNLDQSLYADQEQQQKIKTSDVRDSAVTTVKIKDLNVTTAKIANDAINGTKIADDSIDSEHIVADSIDTEHYAPSSVDTTAIADNSVTMAKLGTGALPTNITVNSTNISNDSIVDADINSSAAIAGTKISPNFGSQNIQTSGTAATGALGVTGNITVSGTVDGRDLQTDGTKLDGVEASATADQTAAEIRTLVESASDSHVFTDADHTKLNGIETAATADQTSSELKILFQSNKLTDSEIATGTLDNRYYTETELNNGQLDNRYFTETECEANFLRQNSSETIASGATWNSSDSFVATTAAIDLRVVDLIDDVGGFVAIANQTSFPTANPDVNNGAGTIVSVKAASTNLAPSGTTVTIANGAGSGNTVTVTGVSATIPSGFGFLVETTTTLHTYTFHRLVPKATEVSTVAANAVNIAAAGANVTNIDSFADRYQISSSAPTTRSDSSALAAGDLWFDSSSNKVMMVYDASAGDGFSPITPNQSDLTNINIVAGQVTFQEDLGLITNAVSTGSGNNSVNTVAGSIANVNTAATNIAKITTVADDLNEGTSEIDTVATSIANVNTVGSAIANVNTVAGSISNVNTVQGSIANVNTTAGSIANVNTVASNLTNVNNFANRYRIASSAPTSSLDVGDLYFDSSQNELRIYNGSAWQGGVTATGNLLLRSGGQMTGNITMSGTQTVDGRDLSADGTKLDGIETSATADQTAAEIVALVAGQTIAPNVITTTNLTLDFGSIA